ncbi:MAG: endo-1,4-beta-xylanase [Lachnospiraceae bacterium]|nr:endo-1,4-beta-xylanase [Lachnospiraceae bacterium]
MRIKRTIAMLMSVVMVASFLPQQTVRAAEKQPEIDWETLLETDREQGVATAKDLYDAGEISLVTDPNWTVGGTYKDLNSHYWTNNSNISMETVATDVSGNEINAVKISSKQVMASDSAGQANFRMHLNVKKGDRLLYAFRIKAVSVDGNEESGTVVTSLRLRPDTDKYSWGEYIAVNDITCNIGEDWKLVAGVADSPVDASANPDKPFGAVIFQQGLYVEDFLVKDLVVYNLSEAVEEAAEEPSEEQKDDGGEEELGKVLEKYAQGEASLLTAEEWNGVGSKGDNCWVDFNNSLTAADVKATPINDEVYGKALHIETFKKADGNYHGQIFFKLTGKVKTGDRLFYAFRMKGISNDSIPGEAVTNMRIRPSNEGDAVMNFQRDNIRETVDDDWTLIWGYADAPADSANSNSVDINGNKYGAFVLQVGMAKEAFEIADLQIFDLSRTPGEADEAEPEVERMSFDEVMQLFSEGKGTVLTYPSLADTNAYETEIQEPLSDNGSDFVTTLVEAPNTDSGIALNIKTKKTGDQAWDAQIYFNLDHTKQVSKGDTLFFGCKVKGISSVTNKEAMFVTANTRIRPDRSTSSNFDITANINADDPNAWTQIYGSCQAAASSTDIDGVWVFQVGNAIQELEIADVFVIDFGKEFSDKEMPVMTKSYLGMDEDAKWRKDALERIERIRKQDVTVKVVDKNGNPVEGAKVTVEQQRHAFGFGTIVNVDEYNKWDAAKQAKYKEAFEKIAHNRAGFENALKHYYITDPTRQGLVDEWLDYFDSKDMDVRGHVLIYGDDSRLRNVDMGGVSTDMPEKDLFVSGTAEGNNALMEWSVNHIRTYMEKYKGRIYNWDVVNENMTSHDWANRLSALAKSDADYGFDTVAEWFSVAGETDPDVKLTYNDYGILSRDKGHQDYHYELCKYLTENSPITTIGIQGHVSLISPIEIINILDRFSELGKEIEITEFTYEDDDLEFQARFTKDFMIAVFSEEAVTSITTWGFYQGCMYQPKASMVDNNFNLKPNGQIWRDMIYDEWWTDENGVTDSDGSYQVRAFKGTQRITVTNGDFVKEYEVEAGDGPVELTVVDDLSPVQENSGEITDPETPGTDDHGTVDNPDTGLDEEDKGSDEDDDANLPEDNTPSEIKPVITIEKIVVVVVKIVTSVLRFLGGLFGRR